MPSQSRYPQEMRERAVRLVRQIREEEGERAGALKRVSEQLGVHYETLRLWVRQDEIDSGQRGGVTTADAQRIKELEREVRELRRSNEILRSASAFFRAGARPATSEAVSYIDTHKDRRSADGLRFGVEPICCELQVAPSTYYAAKARPLSARAVRDAAMKIEIARIYDDNYRVYGQRKVWRQAQRENLEIGRDQTARLMRALGLQGVRRGKVRRTTIADPATSRAPDLAASSRPGRTGCGSVTSPSWPPGPTPSMWRS